MNLEDEIKNGGVRWIVRLTSIRSNEAGEFTVGSVWAGIIDYTLQ